jgi:AraC-like DNA-binding protein
VEHLQAPGFTALTAPSGREAFAHMLRYAPLFASAGVWDAEVASDVIRVRWRRSGELSLGMRLANESGLAQFVTCLRQIFGEDFAPARVSFRHRAPPSARPHRAFFRCAVDFGESGDEFTFSPGVLDRSPPLANSALSAYLAVRAEAALLERPPRSLAERLRVAVQDELGRHEPELGTSRLSRVLGLSERTLRRRLESEGAALRTIVDDARRDAARRLLEDTDLPVTDIALRVGYADSSAFTHAAQRWFGRSPSQLRRGRS